MASFVDYQQNPLFINILPLFWFYNDTLDLMFQEKEGRIWCRGFVVSLINLNDSFSFLEIRENKSKNGNQILPFFGFLFQNHFHSLDWEYLYAYRANW